MADASVADQMMRLKLKLLEKKLEAERENMEDHVEPAHIAAGTYDGEDAILQSALRRRKELLHQLREQRLLEELSGPSTWGGSPPKSYRPEGLLGPGYQPFPAGLQPEQPRIIQQTVPQPPATIIQQLPQQPLITQIPPAPTYPPQRSGSIREDMVEMMLMQNAQMHQIVMHNMMLKVLPPGDSGAPWLRAAQQDAQRAQPWAPRADKPRAASVHHHHHYGPPRPAGPSRRPALRGLPRVAAPAAGARPAAPRPARDGAHDHRAGPPHGGIRRGPPGPAPGPVSPAPRTRSWARPSAPRGPRRPAGGPDGTGTIKSPSRAAPPCPPHSAGDSGSGAGRLGQGQGAAESSLLALGGPGGGCREEPPRGVPPKGG
ncbi:uncharacterized protein C21orf58 homolog [Monodelphis domestica]|uniref:uncharacterized protein C21orf58 homolog n=1 Tax=Monodelphis domestica TaxID=13616 RepID=UPI0024E1FB1E|nr:uncharacterized protein C21orf58 homolog [Monodelphis domestica]